MRKSVTIDTFVCDRCNEEVESLRAVFYNPTHEEVETKFPNSMVANLYISQNHGQASLSELCPKCWDALREFLKPKQI